MIEQTTPIKKSRRFQYRFRASALFVLVVCVTTACSSSSSKDDAGEAAKEPATQPQQQAQQSGSSATHRGEDDAGGSGVTQGNKQGATPGATRETPDPQVLIRRLDRLVTTTDQRMLRAGISGETSSLSLESLEASLQSAKARMHTMEPPEDHRP